MRASGRNLIHIELAKALERACFDWHRDRGLGQRRRVEGVSRRHAQASCTAGPRSRQLQVLFVVAPTLVESNDEAQERVRRRQGQREAAPEITLAMMGSLTDIAFSTFDLHVPLAEFTTNGQQGTLKRFLAQGRTLREVASNYIFGFEGPVVGTVQHVADVMEETMEQIGGDGFMFNGPLSRRYVAEITDGHVPELQRRGLVRTAYVHTHFPRQSVCILSVWRHSDRSLIGAASSPVHST